MNFTIRLVRLDELDAILEVYRQCEDFLALGPVAQASIEMVRKDIEGAWAEGRQYCGIYDPESHLMGVLDYLPSGFEGDPRRAFIELLMIAAPYRQLGLGSEVVHWVEQQVAENPQVSSISLGTQVNNPAAIRFWKRNGYNIIRGPELQSDSTIAYRLEKAILRTP